jgi:hypothetical protein
MAYRFAKKVPVLLKKFRAEMSRSTVIRLLETCQNPATTPV